MSQPWLSVIMPTYNGVAFLAQTLTSMAVQAQPDIEIIAVDDGSTDATLSILDRFLPCLQMHIHARGRIGNWVANTNYGLAHARGRYVCFLHQDDMWLPSRLRAMRRLLAQHQQATLFFHASRYIDKSGRHLGVWRSPLPSGCLQPEPVVERLLVQNFIAVPAPIFSRETALRVGSLDEELWYTADWDFWLKLAQAGTTVYHPTALAAFRIHPLSQTAQGVARAGELRRQIEVVLNRHLPPWEANHPGHDDVGRAARMSLEINHALAACAYGDRPAWLALARDFLALGPAGWHRFFRDSRIVERVAAQLRARTIQITDDTPRLWPRVSLPQTLAGRAGAG